MGDEVSRRTRKAFDEGLAKVAGRLDDGIEVGERLTIIDRVAANTVASRVQTWTA